MASDDVNRTTNGFVADQAAVVGIATAGENIDPLNRSQWYGIQIVLTVLSIVHCDTVHQQAGLLGVGPLHRYQHRISQAAQRLDLQTVDTPQKFTEILIASRECLLVIELVAGVVSGFCLAIDDQFVVCGNGVFGVSMQGEKQQNQGQAQLPRRDPPLPETMADAAADDIVTADGIVAADIVAGRQNQCHGSPECRV